MAPHSSTLKNRKKEGCSRERNLHVGQGPTVGAGWVCVDQRQSRGRGGECVYIEQISESAPWSLSYN